MPSPVRRSTRAAQPPAKPAPPASNTSSSSLSSSRRDRITKPTNDTKKSATPHSLSSEEMSEPPRRSKRSQPSADEEAAREVANADEEAVDEEEITRCLCNQQEYPGPPLSEAFSGTDAQSEDAGGLFIQCDGCSVWQHGGCVGIVEESQSPDKYYCEECRPKQHEVHTDSRGQRYSLYLPVTSKVNRKTSVSNKSDDKSKKERENSRASVESTAGKRRGTIRSREHDEEDEQLKRALEESTRDTQSGSNGNGRRNGKRGRDESEDVKQEVKRQRTASDSLPAISRVATKENDSSEDDSNGPASRSKKARADAVQNARAIELREKEKERERARAEAAGRRQERAGRRRADEADGDETPKAGASARTSPPPSSQPPSPPAFAVPEKVSHKKGAGKKVKKLGNNQYTKARELAGQASTSSPHSKKKQLANPGASSSDEPLVNGDTHTTNSTNKNSPGGNEPVNGKSKLGKGKKAANGVTKHGPEEVDRTIPNMKRALDGMMGYIQRQQAELAGAGNSTPSGADVPRINVQDSNMAALAGGAVQPPASADAFERPFEELSAVEMADRLSRNIVAWQTQFGQYA